MYGLKKCTLLIVISCGILLSCSKTRDGEAGQNVIQFSSEMIPEDVVTGSPEKSSNAHANATLLLAGNTLHVNGSFSALSSRLRDMEETPDDPGVHIHPGARGEENSYIFGLQVNVNPDERSGTFFGTFELSDEEITLLLDQRLYMDIHTVDHNPGEVRGQIVPEDSEASATLLYQLGLNPESASTAEVAARYCDFRGYGCGCLTALNRVETERL